MFVELLELFVNKLYSILLIDYVQSRLARSNRIYFYRKVSLLCSFFKGRENRHRHRRLRSKILRPVTYRQFQGYCKSPWTMMTNFLSSQSCACLTPKWINQHTFVYKRTFVILPKKYYKHWMIGWNIANSMLKSFMLLNLYALSVTYPFLLTDVAVYQCC